MKRWWLAALAMVFACEGAPGPDGAAREHAIIAVDMEPLAAPLGQDGLLPTSVQLIVDGSVGSRATLPAPTGLLDGRVALAVTANEAHELTVQATYADGTVATSEPRTLTPAADELVLIPLDLDYGSPNPIGHLLLGPEARVVLPLGTRLAVDWLDRQGDQAADEAPVSAIARLLGDPTVIAVIPYTESPSSADEVGALVAGERELALEPAERDLPPQAEARAVTPAPQTVAARPAPEAATVPTVSPAPRRAPTLRDRITSWRLLRVTMGAALSTPTDLLYYYSYCDCGRPAPDRPYTLTLQDGRALKGTSDRYGFVLIPRGGEGRLDFGPTQRQRARSYDYTPDDPTTQAAMLDALGSDDANTVLTALLDLRQEPLPEAFHPLVALLDHAELSVRLNAAVALSGYGDGARAALVACRAARMSGGDDQIRMSTTLGALRHPAAVPALLPLLDSDDPEVRGAAAWALGFIGDPRALAPLEWALSDPDAAVRGDAALAVGRIGSFGTLDALDSMLTDTSSTVVGRAGEAIALATW